MVSKHFGFRWFTIGGGITKRFALGFSLDLWSFNIDLGPLWFYIEW